MEAIQGGVQGYPWLNLSWSSALGTKDCLGKKMGRGIRVGKFCCKNAFYNLEREYSHLCIKTQEHDCVPVSFDLQPHISLLLLMILASCIGP